MVILRISDEEVKTMIVPVKKNRVYENVAAQIQQQIEDQVWTEGMKLQGELELAKRFQVSRGSVREAIKSLQLAGILEAHSGQGTFVAANALQKIKESRLTEMIGSAAHFDEVIECRYIIEVHAAQIAAQNCTEQDIEILENNYRNMMVACNENREEEMLRYATAFHMYIVNIMHNEIISAFYNSIISQLTEERLDFFHKREQETIMEGHLEHKELIEAFRAHDAELAKSIMQRQLGRKMRTKPLF